MSIDRQKIESIVEQVVRRVTAEREGATARSSPTAVTRASAGGARAGEAGIFEEMEDAIQAAHGAQQALDRGGVALRRRVVQAMREAGVAVARDMARLAVEETKMGRVEHKIIKNEMAARLTPGVEDVEKRVLSGDEGEHIVWGMPYGVVAAITPTTNPTSTVINNGISIIAAGNAVVFCPHPQAIRCTTETIAALNRAIVAQGGPPNLMTSVSQSSLETTTYAMKHDLVSFICATGAGGVVRAALQSGKKCIAAGPGNPPVLVDETANLRKAARDIIEGAYFDNDLPCVGEKEMVVVDRVADELVRQLRDQGGYQVSASEETRLTRTVVVQGKINRALIGKDAAVILGEAGISAPADTKIAFFEAEPHHPLVEEEQLMPVVPLVRVKDFEEAVRVAVEAEHGYEHTAIIHSNNLGHISAFARAIRSTLFIVNAPSYAWAGKEGEGWTTLTVGGPTGEGMTSARHFVKTRHFVMANRFGPEGRGGLSL